MEDNMAVAKPKPWQARRPSARIPRRGGAGRSGITLVEILIYLGVLGVLGGGAFEGYHFFREWQCNKNMDGLNQAIEQYVTESRKPLTGLDDLKGYLKGASTEFPKCSICPGEVRYLLDPSERKVRCPFHGLL